MFLAIDVGNTDIVLGVHNEDRYLFSWRTTAHAVGTPDDFRQKVDGFLKSENIRLSDIETVLYSSVVPRVDDAAKDVFKDHRFRMVDHLFPFSFKIRANPAEQVGADRLVNAEAAVREHGAPVIVVDSGTATTLCAISESREYLGGAIMPGMKSSMDSLTEKASKLSSVQLTPPKNAIGTNTNDALQSGIILGYAEMIDGMIRRFKKELNQLSATVVATGGVARTLKEVSLEIDVFDTELTLKGLAYLYDAIRSQ